MANVSRTVISGSINVNYEFDIWLWGRRRRGMVPLNMLKHTYVLIRPTKKTRLMALYIYIYIVCGTTDEQHLDQKPLCLFCWRIWQETHTCTDIFCILATALWYWERDKVQGVVCFSLCVCVPIWIMDFKYVSFISLTFENLSACVQFCTEVYFQFPKFEQEIWEIQNKNERWGTTRILFWQRSCFSQKML